jgi:hypothetical protein
MDTSTVSSSREVARSWPVFILLTAVQLWLAHAIAFFAHEYSHSTTAWLLGWKANPLALHYSHPSIAVILAQYGIDENVDYTPIFASGHHNQAGIIAAAGMILGNALITYALSRWLYKKAKQHGSQLIATFAYWLTVASLGNLIDYVPVRTFAFDDDMHTVATGFQVSPWIILLVFGIPFLIMFVHFFRKIESQSLHWLFPKSPAQRIIVMLLTAFVIFAFYGSAGWVEYSGPVSTHISMVSVCVVFPLIALWGSLESSGLSKHGSNRQYGSIALSSKKSKTKPR